VVPAEGTISAFVREGGTIDDINLPAARVNRSPL